MHAGRHSHIPLQRSHTALLVLRALDCTEHLVRIDDRTPQVLCGISAPGLMGTFGVANRMCVTCVRQAVDQGWTAIRQSERSWLSLRRLRARAEGTESET